MMWIIGSTVRFGDGTVRFRESDFCWIRNRQIANRYTCPFLLTLSAWWWRLKGRRVYWYLNTPQDRVFLGYAPGDKSYLIEAPCVFPHSWIRAECNFWNWLKRRGRR